MLYEYKCPYCGAERESNRPVSEYKADLLTDCKDPFTDDRILCRYKRILSPTPTTFVFNDKKR